MRTLQKYKIVPGKNILHIQNCEKILSVGYERGDMFLFALVDSAYTHTFNYDVMVFGNDWIIIEDILSYKYLGLVSDYDASMTWHVFYK